MWRRSIFSVGQHSWKSQWLLPKLKSNYVRNSSTHHQVKLATKLSDADLKEGNEIEGFTIQEVSDVPEFHLKAIRLYHEKSGAQYLHLQRDDSNNAFSVNIRTTPFDSTGIPHILEHTTLCGSKNYPCKDPFFKMENRSMATFMNAMTGPDYTLYPFATQNRKDYSNLMSIYLDAVFNPQLRELDFRQEGWRLEHEDIDDPNSPIVFKGVVFNEMKGALCDNQRIFGEGLLNKILPSHTYGVISGGDPLHIPHLTYEKLKAFHSQYYHPSNARFYSYGNFDLKDHLQFISKSYLEKYGTVKEKYSESTEVPSESRWSSVKKEHIYGKVDNMAANPEKQATLAVSYLCSDIKDIDETFLLQFLSELLLSGPNSSFYKSLVEPNVGSGLAPVTGYEGQTKDTIFTVGLQGLNPKDFDWVVDTFYKTIDKVIQEGFEQNRIDALLHRNELNIKHQSADFGLRILFGLSSLWNHDGDIIRGIRVNDQINKFKKSIASNPRFLQETIEKYFKVNKHGMILTMSPDEKYEENKLKLEEALLKSKVSSLTPDMKKKIYEDGIALRNEQDKQQDLNCLPTLKINDLKKDVESDGLTHVKTSEVPVQLCVQPTNCLTYVRGILNISHLPDESKPFVPLFCHLATKMGTELHNYREMDQLIQTKCGGLDLGLHTAENINDSNSYEEGILFSSFGLDSKVSDMFSLWEEIFNRATYEDQTRLETLMKSCAANFVSSIADNGHLYAMSAAAALVNPSALVKEYRGGLTYVRRLCNIVQNGQYKEVLGNLKAISKEVLNKKYLRLAINLSPENHDKLVSNVGSFVNSLNGSLIKSLVTVQGSNFNGIGKSGIQYDMPFPVSYTSKALPSVPYSHDDFTTLRVLCRLLSSKYLLPQVREKGGAYGSGVNISPAGVIQFFSYRDPKPVQTFETYDACIDWIAKREFTEEDIEEAKLGTFRSIDAPVPPGSRGTRNFLFGISENDFQLHRLHLMTVTTDDVVRVATEYLDPDRGICEGRILLGPKNTDISKRPGENWTVHQT